MIYDSKWVCILIKIKFVDFFKLVRMRLLMMENTLLLKMGLMMMNYAIYFVCFLKYAKLWYMQNYQFCLLFQIS